MQTSTDAKLPLFSITWTTEGLFSWAPKSLQMVIAVMKLKDICSLEGKLWPTRQHIKKQRHYFANKGLSSQSYGFSNGHAWVWELDHKGSWVWKNWCFWTVVLKKTLESPLDCKEINQSILKEISPEYSLEGLMLKLKLQYSGHLMRRADSLEKIFFFFFYFTVLYWLCHTLTRKDLDAGKDWRQEEKGMTEDEMVGWHHWLDGHEFEKAPAAKEAWHATVHGVAKSQIQLSNWTELGVKCILIPKYFLINKLRKAFAF